MQKATFPHSRRAFHDDLDPKEMGTAMGLFGPWPYVIPFLFILCLLRLFFRLEEDCF